MQDDVTKLKGDVTTLASALDAKQQAIDTLGTKISTMQQEKDTLATAFAGQ